MYQLIEFEESSGGGLAVISSIWLTPRKTEVYWSPYKELSVYNKAVKNQEPVNESKWQLYKICRNFYSSDDFENINKKLREAEDTSDVQSETENYSRKKRKVKPKKIFETSDGEDNNIEQLSSTKNIKTDENISIDKGNSAFNPSEERNSPVAFNICTPSSRTSATSAEFNETLLRSLMHIQQQNERIIALLANKTTACNTTLPAEFPTELPVTKEEDLSGIEEYINIRQNFSYFVSYLSDLAGKDLVSKTNLILKHIISDNVAKNYNFYGHRQKKAFSDLKLHLAVIHF